MKRSILLIALAGFLFTITGCRKDKDKALINIFSVNDDIMLGQQVEDEIFANPAEYPILSETTYASAYSYVDRVVSDILNSGEVTYKDEFDWRVKLIHNDSVLNAFCAPGGFICVYTGIIKFLDSEDQFAGVMAHEIAHADRRHVTNALTKQYGLSVLLNVVLGTDPSALKEIAGGLIGLTFSRSNETDADNQSVKYLCPTGIDARGAAGFFQKLIDLGAAGGVPQFLSTHPNPDNRVENINSQFDDNCGSAGDTYDSRYEAFKLTLP